MNLTVLVTKSACGSVFQWGCLVPTALQFPLRAPVLSSSFSPKPLPGLPLVSVQLLLPLSPTGSGCRPVPPPSLLSTCAQPQPRSRSALPPRAVLTRFGARHGLPVGRTEPPCPPAGRSPHFGLCPLPAPLVPPFSGSPYRRESGCWSGCGFREAGRQLFLPEDPVSLFAWDKARLDLSRVSEGQAGFRAEGKEPVERTRCRVRGT